MRCSQVILESEAYKEQQRNRAQGEADAIRKWVGWGGGSCSMVAAKLLR